MGVLLLLGFTFFMGLMLSRLLGMGFAPVQRRAVDLLAFGGTGLVFVSMAAWAQATKRDVSNMGKWLMVGLWSSWWRHCQYLAADARAASGHFRHGGVGVLGVHHV